MENIGRGKKILVFQDEIEGNCPSTVGQKGAKAYARQRFEIGSKEIHAHIQLLTANYIMNL